MSENYTNLFNIPKYYATPEQCQDVKFLHTIFLDFRVNHLSRFNLLSDYFVGKHNILKRTVADDKPNNKSINNFANQITTGYVGYLLGNPINYISEDSNLQEILDANDVAFEDSELGKICSIFGCAYELLWIDRDSNIRFKSSDPRNVIVIRDTTIEENIITVMRYVALDDEYFELTIYDKNTIKTFHMSYDENKIMFIDEQKHFFGGVPIVEYLNNKEMISDFEQVIPLIDQYNLIQSDNTNEIEQFANSYLVFKNFLLPEDEELSDMKRNRTLILDGENCSVEYLTKSSSFIDSEALLTRIKNDIYNFSNFVNMNDSEFNSNLSGIAIRFKLFGTEAKAIVKERNMTKALNQRIKLINNILTLKGQGFDENEVKIVFTRNIPANLTEISQMIGQLQTTLSKETLISQLPFISDVQQELDKIEQEKDNTLDYEFGDGEIEPI
jgi:SPP1 family phage portal protein